MPKYSCLALFCLALQVGCDPSSPQAKAPVGVSPAEVSSPSAPPVVPSVPLTEAQKNSFVENALKIAKGNGPSNDFLDTETLFSRTADVAGISEVQRKRQFMEGARKGYANNSLAKNISDAVRNGGSFVFLRFSQRDGHETAIFRFLTNGGLSYYEFALPSSNATNPTLSSDVYVYVSSDWLSETSAKIVLQLKAAEDPSMLNRLFRSAGLTKNDSGKFGSLLDQAKHKNWPGVISAYDNLPQKMKESRLCLMFLYNAAMSLKDDAKLSRVVEDLRKYCTNDPGIDLLSLDYYIERKEFGKAMAALESLDRAVGGDPYLDVLRGSVAFQAGDYDQAIAAGNRAAERDPNSDGALFVVARATQAKRDFAQTAAAFKKLQALGLVTPADVAAAAEFTAFAASPEFQAWQSGH